MYFDSEALLIESKTDARAKIAAIDACINTLLTSVLASVGKAAVQEYLLNDGQTIIKTSYRNPNEVIKAVEALRILRQQYKSIIQGRSVRMVDAKVFYPKKFNR